jgi:hypothetical protein
MSSRIIMIATAGCLLIAPALQAQNVAGSISGMVQDAQGASVPGAKVSLTNDAQGAASTRVVNTTPEGTFAFSPVLAGRYTVSVEMMEIRPVRHHPGCKQ